MTDRELEGRLRGWYAAEVGIDETAPPSLYHSVTAMPMTVGETGSHALRARLVLLAAAALLVGLLAASVAVGSGLLKLPAILPAPTALPSVEATRVITVGDLQTIVELPSSLVVRVPPTWITHPRWRSVELNIHRSLRGSTAVRASNIGFGAAPGLLGARLVEFDSNDPHTLYRVFAAAFTTAVDARRAFEAATAHYQSRDGWGLSTKRDPRFGPYQPDPPLGDKSVFYTEGGAYGYPGLIVYVWLQDNAIFYVVDFDSYYQPDVLRVVAERMDARAGTAAVDDR